MQTLSSFLSGIGLELYHEQFLNAGATDQDLSLLVQFNDQEVTEFLSILDMLPFHLIKLKKSLRDLKHSHNNTQSPATEEEQVETTRTTTNNALELPSTREFIISHATIYGKKKNRALTSYEEAINNAALELALENPLLISKKGSLFDLAKKKLLENGYQYKRGSSRSKLKEETAYNSNKRISSTTTTTTTLSMTDSQQHRDILAKRQENAQIMSDKRLEKIQILQLQVDQALKCRQATENKLSNNESHGALTRLTMEADLIRYEETKIKLTKEISKLKAQERKHQWYKRRKLERCCTNTTDEGFSSQNSTSSTGSSGSSSASAYNCNPNITHQHQHQQQYHHHHSAFSICGPPQLPPPPSSSTQYTLPSTSHHPHYHQEQQDDDDYLSYSSSSSPSSSSISSTTTTTTLLTCSRESDVRASSISNYDR